MATDALVQRALETFDRLDPFGKLCTQHSLGARSRSDLEAAFRSQDDWTLENVTIEEMEFDLTITDRQSAEGEA